jgi:hypothetical protein
VERQKAREEMAVSRKNRFIESYAKFLRLLSTKGGNEEILRAYRSQQLFPTLTWDGLEGETELGLTKILDKLQPKSELVKVSMPQLELVQAELVVEILLQIEHADDASERTKDCSLSHYETQRFFSIAEKAGTEFPGSYICVCDSYRIVPFPPVNRTRTAAVIWQSFSEDSWSRRFAKVWLANCYFSQDSSGFLVLLPLDVQPRHSRATLHAEVPELRQRSPLSVPPVASQFADSGGDRNQVPPLRSPVPSVRGKVP